MTPAALTVFEKVCDAGVFLEPHADGEIWAWPHELVTKAMLAQIRWHRAGLLELLTTPHWHWRIFTANRGTFTVWMNGDGATFQEMANLYPGARIRPALRTSGPAS